MLDRPGEQRHVVNLYMAESEPDKKLGLSVDSPFPYCENHATFQQLTTEISGAEACLSMTTPAVQAIMLFLQNDACDMGLKKTVSEIIAALNNRFSFVITEPIYCVTFALDPRLKLSFCTDDEQLVEMSR